MFKNMKKLFVILLISLWAYTDVAAFCGFYVAKAGADLYNNKGLCHGYSSSQCIATRRYTDS